MNCSKKQMTSNDYSREGMLYDNQAIHEKAIQEFTKAIEADSNNINAYIMRGHMHDRDGHPEIAIHDHNKAIELDPSNPEAYFYRGFSYMVERTGGIPNYQQAVDDFTKAIQLNINIPEVYFYRGSAYKSLKLLEEALSDFKKYIFIVGHTNTPRVKLVEEEIQQIEEVLSTKN